MAACAGMHHHTGRFVDRDDAAVFVENFEGQIFGLRVQWRRFARINLDRLFSPQHVGTLSRDAVNQHAARLDPILKTRSAVLRQPFMQVRIQALSRAGGGSLQMDHEDTTSYIQEVIRSAIVPVAGVGTRLLPATKSQPKEMLPVARKPIVQYVAEELVANKIDQILFVTGRNKTSIENHFDTDPELIRTLSAANKNDLLKELQFEDHQANFFYTRQRLQKGLGDAILCGENFAGEQPFVVALGDSILGLHAQSKTVLKMTGLFETCHATCVIAVEEVPPDQTVHYGIVKVQEGEGEWLRVLDLVEKPQPGKAPSNLAIAGRYAFSPVIFDMIRRVKPDSRGEIQLTDAMAKMCEEGHRVLAVKLPPNERRYDIGNFPSYFETFVEFALADPDYGGEFRVKLAHLLERTRSAGND